ncbi:MAG: hypothetical protein ACYC0X_14870 [Pirellulaceae bacterium]
MTHRATQLAIVLGLFFSFASQASAQAMPSHVHKALGRLVGEWTMETVVEGKTSRSTLASKWSEDQACIIYTWKGNDFVTGKDNSGTGILGWDGARKLVVEHELDSDGSVFTATHQIAENGEWTSPTQGWSIVDGKTEHFESLRVFHWTSDDQWEVKATQHYVAGKRQPDVMSTIRRKSSN